MPLALRTVNASGALAAADYCVLADATSGNLLLTLPPVAGLSGESIMVKKIDGTMNTVSLVVADAAPIIGDPVLVNPYDRCVFVTDGTTWHIIQRMTAGFYATSAQGALASSALQAGSTLNASNLTTGTVDPARMGSGSSLQAIRRNAANTALEFFTMAGGGDMLAANNLSDLLLPSVARTNLGLGTAATTATTAYATAAQGTKADLAAVDTVVVAALALKSPLTHTHAPADITGTAVVTADSRLSDARNPTAHNHAWSAITSGLPTTLAGYGIADGVANTITVNGQALSGNVTVATITGNAGTATALSAGVDRTKLDAITGTNTGNDAVNSLYSGLVSNATHTGEVTGATGLTITAGAVTLAKMADMATSSLIYRKTAGAGAPEVNTLATLKTDLGLTGTNSGDQTSVTGNAGTVTTNANLTGPVTSTGNATAIANGAITNAMLANAAVASLSGANTGDQSTAINAGSSRYDTILSTSGSHTAARVAGTYAVPFGDALAVTGTGTLYPIGLIHIVAADYPTVNGLTAKLRIRMQLQCNDVAPTGNYTAGLYPVTRPATSGGAGLVIYTLGTVVSGSNGATATNPAADSSNLLVGSDFAIPSDGLYCIGIITTATVAVSSHTHICAQLQIHNQ